MKLAEQYESMKQQNPGALVLFRIGDFYELFQNDATIAAKTLGLTLTSRRIKIGGASLLMCGFPYHQLESYLRKLIAAGHRVVEGEFNPERKDTKIP